jgi:hypothetical protein
MCIRVRRGRQRLRATRRAVKPRRSPPGDRRGWPFTWLFGLRRAGCRLRAPEAVADTEQVEGLALDRGGVVTSRKPGRAGAGGGDGVEAAGGQAGQQAAGAAHRESVRGVFAGCLGQRLQGRAARATGLGQAEL